MDCKIVPSERIFMSSFHLKQRFLLHPVIDPAHGVGQKPADGHAPPDACHPDRRDGGQRIGQHHAGAQGYHRQHHRDIYRAAPQRGTARRTGTDSRCPQRTRPQCAGRRTPSVMTAVSEPSIKSHQQRGKHKHQCADRDAEPDGRRNAPRIPLWMRSVFCAP